MVADKQEFFGKRAAKGILWWFVGELVCIIFNICMLAFMMKFMAFRIFTALSSVIIVNGLYINFSFNCAVRDRNLVKYHGISRDRFMSLKIALTAPLPRYLMWIMLLLSKAGVIGDIFSPYILGNIECLAWVDLFTESRVIEGLSWGGLFGLLALTLTNPLCIIAAYECTFREIDIKALLLYGKR